MPQDGARTRDLGLRACRRCSRCRRGCRRWRRHRRGRGLRRSLHLTLDRLGLAGAFGAGARDRNGWRGRDRPCGGRQHRGLLAALRLCNGRRSLGSRRSGFGGRQAVDVAGHCSEDRLSHRRRGHRRKHQSLGACERRRQQGCPDRAGRETCAQTDHLLVPESFLQATFVSLAAGAGAASLLLAMRMSLRSQAVSTFGGSPGLTAAASAACAASSTGSFFIV